MTLLAAGDDTVLSSRVACGCGDDDDDGGSVFVICDDDCSVAPTPPECWCCCACGSGSGPDSAGGSEVDGEATVVVAAVDADLLRVVGVDSAAFVLTTAGAAGSGRRRSFRCSVG